MWIFFPVPDIRGNDFNFFPFSMMLSIGLWYITFTILRYIPSIPSFFRAFIMKGCWIFSKVFLHVFGMKMRFLSFILFMCYIMFIGLHMLNHLWIPGIKPTWSWCMTFLMWYWIRFASILLRIFVCMFINEIGL
jgi:hypothetical protein